MAKRRFQKRTNPQQSFRSRVSNTEITATESSDDEPVSTQGESDAGKKRNSSDYNRLNVPASPFQTPSNLELIKSAKLFFEILGVIIIVIGVIWYARVIDLGIDDIKTDVTEFKNTVLKEIANVNDEVDEIGDVMRGYSASLTSIEKTNTRLENKADTSAKDINDIKIEMIRQTSSNDIKNNKQH